MTQPGRELVCSAMLLDLDGVLVHSELAIARSWSNWAKRNGIDPEEVLRQCHGRCSAETIALVAPHLDANAETERLELSQSQDTADLEPCEGAKALLTALSTARWAVVTSGTRLLATARLRSAGLQIPEVLVTAEDVTRGKPDPQGYSIAALRLGTAPADCIAVEDAHAGVIAARIAGARVIGVAGPQLGAAEDVELAVQSLAELQATVSNGLIVLRNIGATSDFASVRQ